MSEPKGTIKIFQSMHLTLQRKKLRPRRSDMSKDCGMPGAVCKREPEAPTPGQFHPRHSLTVSTDLNCLQTENELCSYLSWVY